MAYSTQREVSDGTLVLLDISIEYFERTEISVLFNGVVDALPWAWVGSTDKKISFTPAVPNTVEVMVLRTSDLSEIRHSLTGGAAFTDQTMDENFQQILHISQEARENANIEDVYTNLNMHGFKITNLAAGVNPLDAVNIGQFTVHDATIVGYRDETLAYRNEAEGFANDAEAAALVSVNNVPVAIAAAATKAVPVDADLLGFVDTEAANVLKKFTWANLKAALKTYFDTLYSTLSLAVANAWTAPQRSPFLVDNGGNFDLAAKQNFKCTPTGPVTLTFSNLSDGLSGYVIFTNTTNYAITKHAAIKCPADLLTKISATGLYELAYVSDGTNVYVTPSPALT